MVTTACMCRSSTLVVDNKENRGDVIKKYISIIK
jgi:hypothetical protein